MYSTRFKKKHQFQQRTTPHLVTLPLGGLESLGIQQDPPANPVEGVNSQSGLQLDLPLKAWETLLDPVDRQKWATGKKKLTFHYNPHITGLIYSPIKP